MKEEQIVGYWVKFDINNRNTWPSKYGKYLISRKDDIRHFETWNGTGWAYHHKSITDYAVVLPPK